MPKGQQKGNKEARKAKKAPAPKPVAATPLNAPPANAPGAARAHKK